MRLQLNIKRSAFMQVVWLFVQNVITALHGTDENVVVFETLGAMNHSVEERITFRKNADSYL
jgi:hypothetical protein